MPGLEVGGQESQWCHGVSGLQTHSARGCWWKAILLEQCRRHPSAAPGHTVISSLPLLLNTHQTPWFSKRFAHIWGQAIEGVFEIRGWDSSLLFILARSPLNSNELFPIFGESPMVAFFIMGIFFFPQPSEAAGVSRGQSISNSLRLDPGTSQRNSIKTSHAERGYAKLA